MEDIALSGNNHLLTPSLGNILNKISDNLPRLAYPWTFIMYLDHLFFHNRAIDATYSRYMLFRTLNRNFFINDKLHKIVNKDYPLCMFVKTVKTG